MANKPEYVLYSNAYNVFSPDADLTIIYANTEIPALWKRNNYINGPAIRDIYILHYCHTGHGTLTIDGNSFPVQKGQTFITFPGCVTTMETNRDDPWAFTWLCFDGKKVKQYFDTLKISPQNPVFPWSENDELHDIMVECKTIYDTRDSAFEFNLTAQANLVFSCLTRSCEKYPSFSTQTSPHQYITQAIGYIDSNLDRRLGVSDIAEHVGLNRTYFSMLFHKETGQTPQEFLIQHRMQKACTFFENPRATVASVSYSLGYEPHVFSRVFKQTIGKTPQQYKKELHNK